MKTVLWTFIACSLSIMLLRFWCKWEKSSKLWWDDWVLAISWVFLLVSGIVTHINVANNGFGIHVCELAATRPQDISNGALLNLVSGALTVQGIIWSKTSFALTLLRIVEQKWMRVTIWCIIAFMNITTFVAMFIFFFQCDPIEKTWNEMLPGGHCWREVHSWYGLITAGLSGVFDIALALMPWTIILGLNMQLAEKIGVAVAMSAGLIAGVTSFIKTSYIPKMAEGDFSYEGYPLIVWSAAEVFLTIIGSCIPFLRVLVRDIKRASQRNYGSAKSQTGTIGGGTIGGARNSTIAAKTNGDFNSRRVTVTSDVRINQHHQDTNLRPPQYQQQQQQNQLHGQDYELSPFSVSITSQNGTGGYESTSTHNSWSQRNVLHSDSDDDLIYEHGHSRATTKDLEASIP